MLRGDPAPIGPNFGGLLVIVDQRAATRDRWLALLVAHDEVHVLAGAPRLEDDRGDADRRSNGRRCDEHTGTKFLVDNPKNEIVGRLSRRGSQLLNTFSTAAALSREDFS
jgi:hypothetical protein